MATFKTVVMKQRVDGSFPVYIRIMHNRKSRYIKTDKIVDFLNIDKKNHEVKDPYVLEACSIKIARFAEILNMQNI